LSCQEQIVTFIIYYYYTTIRGQEMSSTVQISLDNLREVQLAKIQDLYPEVPQGQTDAVKFLLFDCMEKRLKVKK
jgi:hypothetical protein